MIAAEHASSTPSGGGASSTSAPPATSAVSVPSRPPAASAPSAASAALAALRAISSDPRVRGAEEAVREASAGLRWHEALRRRWREARAEAAVRAAIASGSVEGAVLPARVLREHVAAAGAEAVTGDPALDAVAGLWRAGTRLTGWMPDLVGRGRPAQPSARTLLASLHRDVAGPLAAGGRIPLEEVAVPRPAGRSPRDGGPLDPLDGSPDGDELAERLEGLLGLVDLPGAPALVRAAVVHGEMLVVRPFTTGNGAVGRLLVRHLVTRDGLEPTGTAVVDLYPGQAPAAYADAARAYASGTLDGVVTWVVWQAEAVIAGIQEATSLCRAVQAGTWLAG